MSASQTILGFVDARRAETRSSSPSSSSSDSESLRLSSSEDEEDEEDGAKQGAVPGDAFRPGSQTGRRGLAAMIGRVGGHRAAEAPGSAGARNAASPVHKRPPVQPAMTPHSAASPVTV